MVPPPHRHRGPDPRSQARRRTTQTALATSGLEHRVDVGRAPGREPLDPAPSGHRNRRARPLTRRTAAPRTSLRPRPPDPPSTPPDSAAAGRRSPAARRAHPDPRTRPRGLTPQPSPHDQDPGEPSPGTTPGSRTCPLVEHHRRTDHHADLDQHSRPTRESGSERADRLEHEGWQRIAIDKAAVALIPQD